MSEPTARERITIYSDYVCPFCYLGRQSLARYQSDREETLAIDWRPFDLRSQRRGPGGEFDPTADDGKDEAYYERARENVVRLQERYDVDMALDLATDVDSLDAQVASYYVKENDAYDRWLAFDVAILDALWQEGRDIGDVDVLAALADDVGLDPDEIRDAVDDDEVREDVDRQFRDARQDGVTGVPTFAYDGYAARGAVPPAQLRRLVDGP